MSRKILSLVLMYFFIIAGGLIKSEEINSELPSSKWFLTSLYNKFFTNSSNINETIKGLNELMTKLNLNTDPHSDHDHSHNHTDHDHSEMRVNSTSANYSSCYSSEELLEIIWKDNHTEFTENHLLEISPSLLLMAVTSECAADDHDHDEKICVTTKDKYIFGSVSILVIWLTSFLSCIIVARFNKKLKFLILTLRALGVGTLLGDGFLHIVPSALGVHFHDENDSHTHETTTKRSPNDPVWKMSVLLLTIFFLWMLECFMPHNHNHDRDEEERDNHGHSHDQNHSHSDGHGHDLIHDTLQKPIKLNSAKVYDSQANTVEKVEIAKPENRGKKYCAKLKKIQSAGWIAFLGDILHKTADGLAIGAAFSESLSLGFSTSLAILFHEIPHELGDYGILIAAGFNTCTVLILNSITSFFSLVGFFIMASVTKGDAVREWIFAVTAGVFIYMSMSNMIPRMNHLFEPKNGKRDLLTVFLIILFFFIGWGMMILLAIFGENIKIDISSGC